MKKMNNQSDNEKSIQNLEIQYNEECSNTNSNIKEDDYKNINALKNLCLDDILSHLIDDKLEIKENQHIKQNHTENEYNYKLYSNMENQTVHSNNLNSISSPNRQDNTNGNKHKNELTPIKTNSKNETNYENLFKLSSSSPKKRLRASLTIEDLKNDENMLIKSTIAQRDEFLKIEDWEIKLEHIEAVFQDIQSASKFNFKHVFS
jgi:hypothetical protein